MRYRITKRRRWVFFWALLFLLMLGSPFSQAGGGGSVELPYHDFYNQAYQYCYKQVRMFFNEECEAGIQFCLEQLFSCAVKSADDSCVVQNTNGQNEISCLKFPSDCELSDLRAVLTQYKYKSENEKKDPCSKVAGALAMDQPGCGNGVLEPGESCDNGNNKDGDTCPKNCQPPVVNLCGNGKLDPSEECDAGPENGKGESGCDLSCKKIMFVPTIGASGTTSPPDSSVPSNSSPPSNSTPSSSAPPPSPASSSCSLQVEENSTSSIPSLILLGPVIFILARKKRRACTF